MNFFLRKNTFKVMKLHEFIYTSIFIFPKVNTRAIYNDKGRKKGRNKVSERENRNKKK